MLNAIIKWAIARRWLVILGAIVVTFWIFRAIVQMPLDVFPSFAPPQVEIETEASGLAPEEIESLVTLPVESAINGTPGIATVRSSSSAGLSVVRVVFKWGTDIFQARQLVQERLQQENLPKCIKRHPSSSSSWARVKQSLQTFVTITRPLAMTVSAAADPTRGASIACATTFFIIEVRTIITEATHIAETNL